MKKVFLMTLFLHFIVNIYAQDSLAEKANDYFVNQDYLQAASIYDQIYQSDSLNFTSAFKCANALYLAGNMNQTKTYIDKLILKTLDTVECYKILSRVQDYEENFPQAIKSYKYLIKKDSLNVSYRKSLARIYTIIDLNRDAAKEFEAILKLNRADITSYINLADVYLRLKATARAGSNIEDALEIDSTNIKALKLKARVMFDLKSYTDVVSTLNKILKNNDLIPFYYNILGVSYMNLDSFELAEKYLRSSFDVKEYKEFGYYYIATMAEKLKDSTKALEHFQLAIKEGISPYADVYHKRMAEIYIENKNYDKALISLDKANSIVTKPEYIYMLGMAYDFKENTSKAIELYSNYCSLEGEDKKFLSKAKERIQYLEQYQKSKK
jgi:protein O-GlcNAc transferase